MAAPTFDLQAHSLHSDGDLAPTEVVALAAEAGVELFALSDHDTIDGVDEALAAGRNNGLPVIPAVEISAVDGGYEDLHVLGYWINHSDATLSRRLIGARSDREARAKRMADRLATLGFELDWSAIDARVQAGKPVGRPHLAAAVLSHSANRQVLEAEGHQDVSSFIRAYLIPGASAYLPRTQPTVAAAIEWIHGAGGYAIWAHPFWDIDNDETVLRAIDRFRTRGLDGVEVFYPTHNGAQTQLLVDYCAQLGLLTTGSSDFHGPDHRIFNTFRSFELHDRTPTLGPLADERLLNATA